MKTIIVATRKNQEKTLSHLRRLGISQVRHLKTGSLIPCPLESISQSRRLHHFPYPSSNVLPKVGVSTVFLFQSAIFSCCMTIVRMLWFYRLTERVFPQQHPHKSKII